MLKKKIFDTPWKMHFESAFSAFNKQTNLISTGNVIANTQRSGYIRPWSERKCNRRDYPFGYLMEADLSSFRKVPPQIKRIIEDKNREEEIILYQFRVYNEHNEEEVFLHVLTDKNNNYMDHVVYVGYRKNLAKRLDAAKKILPYICHEESLEELL